MKSTTCRSSSGRGRTTTVGWFRLLCALAAGAVLSLTAAGPVAAHSELESSTPAAGATVERPPEEVVLRFNQDIAPEFAQLSLVVADAAPRRLEALVDGRRVSADLRAASEGQPSGRVPWTVAYRVVSADGHPISGTLAFRAPVRPTPETSPATGTSPAPAEIPAAPAPAAAEQSAAADGEGSSSWLWTLVIGSGTAVVVLVAMLLIVRGAKPDPQA